MSTPQTRAETARSLQAEAKTLLETSGLYRLLDDRYGTVKVTGSAGYDLMVWRDIDIHMPVEASKWMEWSVLVSDYRPTVPRCRPRSSQDDLLERLCRP